MTPQDIIIICAQFFEVSVVYIKVEGEEVYRVVEVLGLNDGVYSLRDPVDGVDLEKPEKDCLPAMIYDSDGIQDMVMLENLNEASILFNLSARFFRDPEKLIYTYTGAILMSVNPYKRLPIYTPAVRRAYEQQPLGALPPHVYAIGDVAYRAMLTDNVNQSVLISGESGAGKTEAAKIMLDYIAEIAGKTQEAAGDSEDAPRHKATAHEQILATNPILEAFGNAKTVRNDNSSRFGKMLDVQFDDRGYLIGASINQYLLEQTRVVRQGTGERNYHAFYFVCAGADKTEQDYFQLKPMNEHYYINQSGIYEIPRQNSKYEYNVLKRSLLTAGFTPPEVFGMMKLLAAILWLGNVEFNEVDEKSSIADEDVVNWVAYLLEIDVHRLKHCLVNRENMIRGELFIVNLTKEQSEVQRDTLAKQLYQKQFEWMVAKINANTDQKASSNHSLFVLDIFGFEAFEENVFEQFCINYANERLQHEFNEHVFRLEQESYKKEGIDVSDFTYDNNIPTIELIEKKPRGIMYVLQEQAKFPRSTEATCYAKIIDNHGRHKSFKQVKFSKTHFIVKHYAGEVTYDASNFLHSSKQAFNAQVAALIQESKSKQYADLFGGIDISKMTGRNLKTVGVQFKVALTKLMEDLATTKPHYIRCVKPNELKSSNHFNNASVLRQLRCSGVLETIRIRQGGYPNQRIHQDYLERYAVLNRGVIQHGGDVKENIIRLNGVLGVTKDVYQIGHTKVFLKDQIFHMLEGKRNKLLAENSTIIQSWYKGIYQRRDFVRRKKASLTLGKWLKEYLIQSDPTDKIKEILKEINTTESEDSVVKSIKKLEALTLREKNIDVICDLGANKVLVEMDAKFNDSQKIKKATTHCLAILSNNEENATRVARSGGVKRMVSHVAETHDVDDKEVSDQDEVHIAEQSINLINLVSKHEASHGTVMKDDTVKTLSAVLKSDKQVGKTKELAAKTFGTLTKNERMARAIGRNDDAVIEVISSMQKRKKFGALCTYSLNCLGNLVQNKHNWSSVVEFGGIEVATEVMQNHVGNPAIIKECDRLFTKLAENEDNAKRLTGGGVLELCLKFAAQDPKNCTVSSMNIIDKVLDKDPAAIDRLVQNGAIEQLLEILKNYDEDSEVAQSIMHTLSKMAMMSPEAADLIAQNGGPESILSALKKHYQNAQLAKDAISTLQILAEIDPAILEYVRTAEIVPVLCKAMEANPEDLDLVRFGTQALQLFAVEDDLHAAMDLIARSRMEAQTLADQLASEAAIAIIGNLALISENVDYIVAEGGFPILLSIIGGKMGPAAKGDKRAIQVLASAIRAVGRLLINNENNVQLFLEEGGFEVMKDLFEKNDNSEVVMNAVVGCLMDACSTDMGTHLTKDSGSLEAMIEALQRNPKYKKMAGKCVTLLRDIKLNQEDVDKLLNAGLVEAFSKVLKKCGAGDAAIAKKITDFLTYLMSQFQNVAPAIKEHCSDAFVGLLEKFQNNEDVVKAVFEAMYKLVELDADAMEVFKEAGLEKVLLALVEQDKISEDIRKGAAEFLNFVVNGSDIGGTVAHAQELALKLLEDPNNIFLVKQLGEKLAFLANCADSKDLYKEFLDAGGLEMLGTFVSALKAAKPSLTQEQALKDASLLALKVAKQSGAAAVIEAGVFGLLASTLLENPAYEELGVNLTKFVLEALSQDANLAQALIDQGAVKVLNSVLEHHPLNEELMSLAIDALRQFALSNKDAVLSEDSVEAIMLAIGRLIGTENDDILISSLLSAKGVAEISGSELFMGDQQMKDLIAVLKQYRAPGVVAAGAQLLDVLCSDEAFCKKFLDMQGLDQIAVDLDKFKDDPNVLIPLMSVITKCTKVEGAAGFFEKADIMPRFLAAMDLNIENGDVQFAALTALSAMTTIPNVLPQIVDPSCMNLVMKNLRMFSDSDIIVGAVSDLIFMCATTDNIDKLVNQGFVDALRIHLDNGMIQSKVEAALMRLDPTIDNLLTILSEDIENDMRVTELLRDISKKLDLGAEEFNLDNTLITMAQVVDMHGSNKGVMDAMFDILGSIIGIPEMAQIMLEQPEFITNVIGLLADTEDASQVQKIMNAMMNLTKIEGGHAFLLGLEVQPMVMSCMATNIDDVNVQINGLRILRELCLDENQAIQLLEGGVLERMKALLEKFPKNPQVALEALGLLGKLAQGDASIQMLIDMGAGELLQEIMGRFPNHPVIMKICEQLDPVLNPREPTPPPEPEVVESEEPSPAPAPPPAPKPAPPPPPKINLKDLEAEASKYELDMEFDNLEGDDDNLARALGIAVDNNADIFSRLQALNQFKNMDPSSDEMTDLANGDLIRKLVGALNRCVNNPKLLSRLIGALEKLATNEDCFKAIVANGGIAALLKALRDNIEHASILCDGISLLGSLARNDHLKTLIGLQGAIQLILTCMSRHPMHAGLQDKGCICLANLSVANTSNIDSIVSNSGIGIIIRAQKNHAMEALVQESALVLLSNICYHNDKNRVKICQSGGAETIVAAINNHMKAFTLLENAFKALGNLSAVRKNIGVLVKHGAAEALLSAIKAVIDSEKLLQIGVNALLNIVGDSKASVRIIKGGVLQLIVQISEKYNSSEDIQFTVLGCIGHLSNTTSNIPVIIDNKIHTVIHGIMERLDNSQNLLVLCFKVLKSFSRQAELAVALVKSKTPTHIVQAMQKNRQTPAVVRSGCNTLTKMLMNEEISRLVARQGVIEGVVDVSKSFSSNPAVFIDVMKVFINLCPVESSASTIAKLASTEILRAIEFNNDNQILLNIGATLLFNIAIHPSGSRTLTKRGAVEVIKNTIEQNMEHQGVVAKFIRVMTNLLLTDNKSVGKMMQCNVKETVRLVSRQHMSHQQIQKAARSFVRALRQRTDDRGISSNVATVMTRDKLPVHVVNLLTSGTVMRKFHRSKAPRKRRVKTQPNCEIILFEDTKGKKAPLMLKAREMYDVRKGACTLPLRKKKMGHRQADPDRSFAIFVRSGDEEFSIDLETRTIDECSLWVEALNTLREVLRPKKRVSLLYK